VQDQWALGKLIVKRQTELGIGSILPAFQGNVPKALAGLFPKANISVEIPGQSSSRGVGWLDGLDPLFAKISDMVLQELISDFGRTGFYEADGFFNHAAAPWLSAHVDGSTGPRSSTKAAHAIGSSRAAAVYASMQRADASAVWVYQGWPWKGLSKTSQGKSFMQGFTSAVPYGSLVILDLEAESQEVWRASESFYGATFIWCAMDDFGGTNGLFGDITDVANRSAFALADAPSYGGVGISMEGIYQNAPYYTAVLQHAFQPAAQPTIVAEGAITNNTTDCPNCCKPKCLCTCCCPVPADPPGFNTTAFLIEWGLGRCGAASTKVEQAWALLAQTVYRPGK
jgi:alpha-N-acetylglucosaminidase